METLQNYSNLFFNTIVSYCPKLIAALVLLFFGLYVIRFINKLVKKIMINRDFEPTLSKFLADILNWSLRILLFVSFISKLGIETSSFVAILGAAGLAIGLSLQGSLSNFAGGMLIILFKPFSVGDTIEAQGVIGTVQEIQIFVTKIISANNQIIFLPNGILSNGIIINNSISGIRRADLLFSLSYNTDIAAAKEIVFEVLNSHPLILKDPISQVVIRDITDNAIHLAIRPWTKTSDLSIVNSDVLELCKDAFDKKGIVIQPFSRSSN